MYMYLVVAKRNSIIDYSWKVIAPSCVCVCVWVGGRGGAGEGVLCFPSGQPFSFVSSDRKLQFFSQPESQGIFVWG